MDDLLEAVGMKRRGFSEIRNRTETSDDGLFSRHLSRAMKRGLTSKSVPVNTSHGKKRIRYEISDNALRFYYTYVYPNMSALVSSEPERFYDEYIGDTLEDFVSFGFANICKSYLEAITRDVMLGNVREVGRCCYVDKFTGKKGEFDLALLKDDGRCEVCFAKLSPFPMTKDDIEMGTRLAMGIESVNVESVGFISVSGFEDGCEGILIDGDTLYRDRAIFS
ncbi:MAG: DUF234 domain-containing protein [Clostridia bacterium]|nr:DUF234 domain-containing protein [Clostridia bacterium]